MSRVIEAFKQFFDDSGAPLSRGALTFFETGTSSERNTFQDNAETVLNTNPVILDGEGRAPDIFGTGAYKVVLRDVNGVQIDEFDPVGQTDGVAEFGDWDNDILYSQGDFVVGSDGEVYRSLTNNNLGNDPVSDAGASWEALRFLGVWRTGTPYVAGDVVQTTDGQLYYALQASTGVDPSTSLGVDWQQYWHTGNLQKTTGPTDDTAGRVTLVGDFGLGSTAPTVADCDTVEASGFYACDVSTFNAPTTNAGTLTQNEFNTNNGGMQVFVDLTDGAIYVRYKTSGTWQAWRELLAAGDFGIGDAGVNITDWNSVSDGGFYSSTASTGQANTPDDGKAGWVGVVGRLNNGNIFQQVWQAGSPAILEAYTRFGRITDNTWGPWQNYWTTSNLVKTTSRTDVTAGSVTLVGDFGLGAEAIAVTNWDTVSVSGSAFYRSENATQSNSPDDTANGWAGNVIISNDLFNSPAVVFVVEEVPNSETPRMFYRCRESTLSGWGDWVQVSNNETEFAATDAATDSMTNAATFRDVTWVPGIAGADYEFTFDGVFDDKRLLRFTKPRTTGTLELISNNQLFRLADGTTSGGPINISNEGITEVFSFNGQLYVVEY